MQLSVNGAPVFVHTGGRGFDAKKPVAVFVHGAGLDHTVWGLQARYVAHHGFSVLVPDLPGHGRSGGAALASVADIAEWLMALLGAAGVETASLIGHSMGAVACLEAAARHPARVARVALFGAARRMAVHPDLLAAAGKEPETARDLIVDWGFGRRGRIGGNRAPGLWMMGAGQRLLDHAASGVLAADLAACEAWRGGDTAPAAIACPALFVLGRQDRMTPAKAGRELAARVKGAEIAEIEDAGHLMMLEEPDRALDVLRPFLGAR